MAAAKQLLGIAPPLWLVWTLLTAGCSRQPVCAVVLSADETVAWASSAASQQTTRPLRNGDLVCVGERAGTRAQADEASPPLAISLLPGVDLALGGDSAVTLTLLRFDKLANDVTAREAAVTWRGGRLVCSLSASPDAVPAHLRVEFAGGNSVLAGPGSLCGFWDAGDSGASRVRIVCARGFVEIGGERLGAGHFRDFLTTAQLSPDRAAASDGAVQRDILTLRAAEKILQGLEARRQDAPPRWWR